MAGEAFAQPMAQLTILEYPDPRLHTVAKPYNWQADGAQARAAQLAADMLETMYAAKGIGLAATQVNVHERVIVIDVSETRDQPLVLINPELTWASPDKEKSEEGCLSVPGVYDGVSRSKAVRVMADDATGLRRELSADGLLAVCMQHEMDHLAGKVFVEYLSLLKRTRIKAKAEKEQREAKRAGARA
jgi:peptide deformylase